MPQQRLPSLIDPPIGFAHRGASAHAPENTLEAFALALRLGASGLESDVWLTADGVPVLDHDGVVRRGVRRRPISTVARAELPSHVPTLGELFAACGGAFELSLDLKDPAAGPAVLAEARAGLRAGTAALWLCHPELDVLQALRPADSEVRLVNSTKLAALKDGPERRAATLADLGIDAVNLHHASWTGGLTTLFHRFGRIAFARDLQFERPLRETLRMGIDGVFGDWVDRIVDAMRAEIGG